MKDHVIGILIVLLMLSVGYIGYQNSEKETLLQEKNQAEFLWNECIKARNKAQREADKCLDENYQIQRCLDKGFTPTSGTCVDYNQYK